VSSDELTPLIERLARARGIGDAYHSYKGELKHFTLATKTAILRAMHCRLDDAAALNEQIRESEAAHPQGLLGDVVVLRNGARAARINTPAIEKNALLKWTVKFEGGGGTRSGEVRAWDLPERGSHQQDGKWFVLRDLPLPADLLLGYHQLEIELEFAGRETCALIVAPDRCLEPADLTAGGKLWGVAVQLYALRSETNWGMGDFSDLAELLRLAAAAGAGFIGISPVHALFPSDPTLFSPYSASSRHALNVMFIDVATVLEVQGSRRAQAIMADPGFRARLTQVRAATQVDYPAVASLKMTVLRAAFERFRTEHLARHTARAAACRAFQRERGEAMRLHTLFDAIDGYLRRHHGTGAGWHSWPEEYRTPGGEAVRRFAQEHADEVDFHAYLQWIAAEQLGAVRQLARELKLSVGLYGDYAVGVNASGSETWSDQSLYCTGAAIGAPPDPIGLGGQEWGIPPQDPRQLRRTAYAPFVALVRASMRNCGALRLDHVMALFRQWWVPRGFKSADGGYVHYPLDELLGVVALESHRNQCLIVGEDLGVVPDEIRRALPQYGVYHYKVVLFEQKNGEFVKPESYVRHALAVVTTHDLPTLHGWWSGHDIDLWEKLGVYADASVGERARAERQAERERLLRALRLEKLWPEGSLGAVPEYSSEFGRAVHAYLAKSPTALVTVQIEDLIGMLEPVNVPGTSSEYSNWTRRVTLSAREVFARPDVREFCATLSTSRKMAAP
jgi:4-alpha-glucanotransferase